TRNYGEGPHRVSDREQESHARCAPGETDWRFDPCCNDDVENADGNANRKQSRPGLLGGGTGRCERSQDERKCAGITDNGGKAASQYWLQQITACRIALECGVAHPDSPKSPAGQARGRRLS